MTFKTILRTTLATVLALALVATPVAAAVPAGQDAEGATWVDLRSLIESVYRVLVPGSAATEQTGDPEEPPPLETSESCEDCSDGGQDMDPDG